MHYRKIWEKHNKTKLKPGMEIHHIDGNRDNNTPENLQAVTIEEHYNIHYNQGDFQAASFIAERMKLPLDEYLELKRKAGLKCYENKTGFHKHSSEEKASNGSKGGKKVKAEKLGIFSDDYDRKAHGIKCRDLKIGFHAMSKEERSKVSSLATKGRVWVINSAGNRKRIPPDKIEEYKQLGYKEGMFYE